MKLLICTQKVDKNDAVLGFFHRWIEEFAKQCESLTVICLEKGSHHLPSNVSVLSLGKEERRSRAQYVRRFFFYLWRERNNYDTVFVHMNPEYVVLGGLLWRTLKKPMALWYTHKSVTISLKIAEKLTNIIFTASEKSFRLKSNKVRVVGHGIDTDLFCPVNTVSNDAVVINVGRISPIKGQLEVARVFHEVLKAIPSAQLHIIGEPIFQEDKNYLSAVKKYIKEEGFENKVRFFGAVRNRDMPAFYQNAKVAINFSGTGSLDKDVLEALSCNIPALTRNEAFKDILPDENIVEGVADAATKVIRFLRDKRPIDYRHTIVQAHDIKGLVNRIIGEFAHNDMGMDVVKDTYNAIGSDLSKGQYEQRRWFSDKIRKAGYDMTKTAILRYAPSQGSFRHCVEFGPGAGTWTELLLQKYTNADFDVVDISAQMLDLTRKRFVDAQNIRYFERNFLDFTSEKKYDFFFSSRALEYIPDKSRAVEKISELLVHGGRGFLITKTPKYIINRLLGRTVPSLHRGQIDPMQLKKIFEQKGFKDIRIYPVTMSFPVFHSAFLNRLLFFIFSRFSLNAVSKFFSESYCVMFIKK